MILRDLTRAERNAYESALTASEIEMRIEVIMRDRDEKPIGSLTADPDWERADFQKIPGVLDGQVDVDWTADVTHQLNITVSDPHGRLVFDHSSPAQGGLHIDKFVSVRHLLWVPELAREIPCPVFWGPVTRFDRDGYTVNIEGMGKELLALDPFLLWTTVKLHKGMLVTEAIKKLMREQGERRFDLPNIGRKLHRDMTIGRRAEAWRVCKRLANSIDRVLVYDGNGKLRMRRVPDDPTITLTDAEAA